MDAVESMFSIEKTPWHGKGNIIKNKKLNVVEGLEESGLDWFVRKERLYTGDGLETDGYATVRNTDNKILGIVGEGYEVLQNWEAFDFFQAFLDSGEVNLETAGSLMGGSKIWVLAKINQRLEIVQDDYVDSYLLLSHSHDGSLKIRVGFTPIRVVCMNTLVAAHGDKASKLISAKHTKKYAEKLELIKESINLMKLEFKETAKIYEAMSARLISRKELDSYIKKSLGLNDKISKISGEMPERSVNLLNRIKRYFEESPGNELPDVRYSLWAAYNAVTYYLNYDRGHNDDTRLTSLFFGDSYTKNEAALITAISLL